MMNLKELKMMGIRLAWTLWISVKLTVAFAVGAVLYLTMLCDVRLHELSVDWAGVLIMIIWGAMVSLTTLKEYNKITNK